MPKLTLTRPTVPTLTKYQAKAPAQERNGEKDSLAEMNAVQSAFKERAKQENQRFVEATDSEYWFCVCFQTREQKDEFLSKSGLQPIGDKYLDGLDVAKRLGIKIESPTPPMPKLRIDKKWLEFTK